MSFGPTATTIIGIGFEDMDGATLFGLVSAKSGVADLDRMGGIQYGKYSTPAPVARVVFRERGLCDIVGTASH
jgi:hypothetical protein